MSGALASKGKFADVALGGDFKTRAVRGGLATAAAQACKLGLDLGSTVLLARLLLPRDYGLVGMATAVVGFMALFKDMGLSMATVQRQELTHVQANSSFWFNVATSSLLCLLAGALAPAVAWFYNEPRLVPICCWLGFGFVLSGLTIQHQAVLRRQMLFRQLAASDILAAAAGAGAGIAAAALHAGYWALVVKSLAAAAANMAAVWHFSSWRPSAPGWHRSAKPLVIFGGYLTASNIGTYFARNLDHLLIGRVWGAVQLGYYSRAYSMLVFPLAQITAPIAAVGIPTLSRLQNDPGRFRTYYLKALSFISFISLPLVGFIFVTSRDIVNLVLGPNWGPVLPIFRCMATAMLLQPVVSSTGWLYVATGQTRRYLQWSLIGYAALILSFVLGLPYGPRGVALSYCIACWAIFLPAFWYATAGTPIKVTDVLASVWKPVLAVLPAGLLAALVPDIGSSLGRSALRLVLCGAAFLAAYAAITAAMGELQAHFRSIAPHCAWAPFRRAKATPQGDAIANRSIG
jgi:PST family polysaccharide transporter